MNAYVNFGNCYLKLLLSEIERNSYLDKNFFQDVPLNLNIGCFDCKEFIIFDLNQYYYLDLLVLKGYIMKSFIQDFEIFF